VVRQLIADGHEVHSVSRRAPAWPDGSRSWTVDLSDPDATRTLFSAVRPSRVVHLAGVPVASRELAMVQPTFASNLASTVHILTAAVERGCDRVVLAGSLETPRPEEVAMHPTSPYAASKWAAETYARMFQALYGLPVSIARIFMTYGPGQEGGKLIPQVVESLDSGIPPRISSGDRLVDWIYVDDVARGIIMATVADGEVPEAFDLGTGELISIRALVGQLVDIVGGAARPEFGAVQNRRDEVVRRADVALTEERLGWRPEVGLAEGLRRTVSWLRTRRNG
jgi:nucleoside-diphosphate-sugar epimerase